MKEFYKMTAQEVRSALEAAGHTVKHWSALSKGEYMVDEKETVRFYGYRNDMKPARIAVQRWFKNEPYYINCNSIAEFETRFLSK